MISPCQLNSPKHSIKTSFTMTGMTAFIVTDPYNEFLHPEGKLNAAIAEDLAHRDAVKHLQALLKSSRANKIPVYYGLHQQTKAGFLLGWNHATPSQQSQRDKSVFAEGSWSVQIYPGWSLM